MKRFPGLFLLKVFVLSAFVGNAVHADQRFVVTYAGAGVDTRFNDVRELSDGTILLAGVSSHLNWIDSAVPRSELAVTGLPAPSGTSLAFIMRLSGDTERILEVVHLPAGAAINLRWIKSIFWDAPANKEQPDFEPAVIAYHADGSMMWWNRLYTEARDTTGDGLIDTTFVSPPDQYIDGLEIDYSVPLSEGGSVAVVATRPFCRVIPLVKPAM